MGCCGMTQHLDDYRCSTEVRGSFQEAAPRKTDENCKTPRWRCWFGGSQPLLWRLKFGGRNNTSIHITSDLKWNTHIDKICAKASSRLYFLKQSKRAGLAADQLCHFYLSAIRTILEYCSVVWHHGLTKTQVEQLEAVQRCAIRIIFEVTSYMPYFSTMAFANISSLHARREDIKNFSERF